MPGRDVERDPRAECIGEQRAQAERRLRRDERCRSGEHDHLRRAAALQPRQALVVGCASG